MRQFAITTVFVVIVALALSFLLLPSQKELGTMMLRDREYEASRAYFEEQIATGDRSPQIVSGLLEIYIRNGDVDRAIELVDSFEEAIGTGPDILRRLADLYRQDRRFGLYLHTLERLTAIAPTAERIEELAEAYYKAGMTEKQVAALDWLRTYDAAPVPRQLELADLQTATGDYASAVDTLSDILDTAPEALDPSYRHQLFDMTLFLDERDRARQIADTVLTPDAPPQLLIDFADVALFREVPDLGLEILERRPSLETSSADWRQLHAVALRALGRDDAAREEMLRWWRDDALPPGSAASLIDLALKRADLDLAVDVVSRFGLERIGVGPALSLIGELHRAGRTDTVDRMLADLGPDVLEEEPILGAEIMLARADTAAATRYADIALRHGVASIDDRLGLANLLTRLDRAQEAFDLLHPSIDDPSLPVEGALLLAELYVRLDRAEDGFWDVAALLARRSTPRLRAIWAQLALATGRPTLVAEWLAREPALDTGTATDLYFLAERQEDWDVAVAAARRLIDLDKGDDTVRRLAYALFRRGEAEEALTLIRPLVPQTPEVEPLYADILGSLGRTDELVALWTRQMARPELSEETRETLVYNLLQAGADGAVWDQVLALAESRGGGWWYTAASAAKRLGRVDDFARLAQSRIGTVDPTSEEASTIVYALSDADRAAAVPLFRTLAESAPAQWDAAYIAVLNDLGRRQELVEWTTARLAGSTEPKIALSLAYALADIDPAAAAEAVKPRATSSRDFAALYAELLRRAGRREAALAFEIDLAKSGRFGEAYTRETAFRALETGDRSTAETLFRQVATDAGPDSESVRQLFYLWGPRPRPDALDWIEARARTASGKERDAWLDKLLEVRAGGRVASLIGGPEGAKTDQDLLHLVSAYAQSDDRRLLREAMLKALARIADPDRLRALARTAENTRDRGLITAAWRAVLNAAPADTEAQRTLGLIAYDEGRLIDAERLLAAYLANGEGDYEANYYYADTLARTDRSAQAMPFYRKAHAQLMKIEPRDFTQEVARANLLRRLGRTEEAVALMDRLVRERPGDEGLRADFADLLIQTGDLRRARSILKLK
ncbi:tetratricopeptide repeat protein [Thalassobaculum sp. OXR-137]|uniref:tetratricopeptide repeat protein n=1 Tax=Thalassobaculum sp. OXR-137 TaxID=3100173 RepID=UPI002AC8E650|nr:tetratricopeptide repeat protein [Thalassobaculum sp. OXR-137]WPZ33485.1 tetratricopeptide repeat protein [Thalassobaculum sp. OXR-137]